MSDTVSSPSHSAERVERLKTILSALYKEYDLETRAEDKLRIKASIVEQEAELEQALGIHQSNPILTAKRIHSDRLPTVEGAFFGREEELKLLEAAWKGEGARIIQFIAAGGTGKTKLIRHWLDKTEPQNVIAWSFYSQGSSEDKQTSATAFFSHVFDKFGVMYDSTRSPEALGEQLADLLQRQRCVLVLDGLEPLQHAGKGMRGELKDRALKQLLKSLVAQTQCLCIITTRIAVHELCDRAQVLSYDLHNLAVVDGVRLLRSLEVKGSDRELSHAVREYGCHALALNLLGNALRTYLGGEVVKRDTLGELMDEYDETGRHAFRVMQAYKRWLAGTPELQVLYLLGLFDHPIEIEVLEALWQARIEGLTIGIERKAWLVAIRALREQHHLLSSHEGRGELLDCHPLIREYFGRQLAKEQPEAWRQAHEVLYGYYKHLPEKELPDTLEEMQPLFATVAHGCAAGLHQEVAEEVYWTRIRRERDAYIVKKIGAFSDDLAVVAHFFTIPWSEPAVGLSELWQASVLSWVGFCLRALGRLREAVEPMQAGMKLRVGNQDWTNAARAASNLSELQLTLGDIHAAIESARASMDYADQSGDLFWRMATLTTLADALHQAGEAASVQEALALFQAAEQLQLDMQPEYTRLYSLAGFRYCDVLLAQGQVAEVVERAEYALAVVKDSGHLLSIALNQLTLGKALSQESYLNQAVEGLRAAGYQHMLPLGLLARAQYYRHTQHYPKAHADLQEVYEIAEPSGMRLHLTDYHLEMARLWWAELDAQAVELPPSQPSPEVGEGARQAPCPPCGGRAGEGGLNLIIEHIQSAEKLINATGYHRRDQELAELKNRLGTK